MSKKSTKLLVPKLRFPEFQKSKEWEKIQISDILTEHGYKSTGVEEVYSVSVHKGLINQIEHLGRSYSAASTNHYKRVLPGDIVYTKSPTGNFPFGIIKQSKLNIPVIVSPLYGVFKPTNKALGYLLDAYFESPENAIAFLEPLAQKGAKNTININNTRFLSGALILPDDNKEQIKIAECLRSFEEIILAETRKLESYNNYKKGLLQKLFPAEGKTVPEWRFPEFRNRGEWENQKISSMLRRVTNPVEVRPDELYQELGIRSHGKGIFHKEPILGNELGNKRVFWVEENAFIVNIVFAWEQAIAITTSAEKGMIVSHRFPMYKSKNNNAIVSYFKYFFLTDKGKELLGIASPGGAGRNKTLGQKAFENLECLSPILVKEQQKISDCLSSIDELILAQTHKIEALKNHKKGLIQLLFLTVDGVVV